MDHNEKKIPAKENGTIRLAYSELYNAGDLMNISLVEKLSGKKVIRSKTYCAGMTAIGGALIGLQYSEKFHQRLLQHFLKLIYGQKEIYIWGSGFLHNYNARPLYRENLKVCALRGDLSKRKLEGLTGQNYHVPLADAGLLIELLMKDPKPEKIYKLGVIPHMWHKDEPAFRALEKEEGVYLIDIMRQPEEVAYDIARCETIISSSLHGLIFADAMHIPNLHVLGDRELRGENFKFEDYYSSFGLPDHPVKLSGHVPTTDEIIQNYRIDPEEVEKKKAELREVFPSV